MIITNAIQVLPSPIPVHEEYRRVGLPVQDEVARLVETREIGVPQIHPVYERTQLMHYW